MRCFRAFVSIIILLSSSPVSSAEDAEDLGEIVVTASRITRAPAYSGRAISILNRKSLDASAYSAISDAIGELGGIDIRRRGPGGVQADINIRGATFEQNSVLIDGVRINDPQTGHHNMDLPISMADIERIEILKGPASSLYGANSFGGVINIITKKPKTAQFLAEAEGGSFDYFKGLTSFSVPLGIVNNRFSFEDSRSTGYMPETEYNILSLSDAASIETGLGVYDLFFGYTKKDFGADGFYSNLFKNEEEHTDTRFFKIETSFDSGGLKIVPKLFLKRHQDKFALDRNRPGWQTNYHTTYLYGGNVSAILENPLLDAAFGLELSADTIDSTNIDRHRRGQGGVYLELTPHLGDRLYVNIGCRGDKFSDFGLEYSPSISACYSISESLKSRVSVGRAYRIPTFTDLYYTDAANIGNPNLHPENSWSYEAGLDYKIEWLDISVTYFYRDSYDTIDWTRASSRDPWRASNIGTVDTNGFEASVAISPKRILKELGIEKVYLNYTALDSYRKHDYLSKYALDYLRQHILAGADIEFYGFKNSWILNYKKRVGDSGYIVLDTKVSREVFRKEGLTLTAFLDISNLFDVDYSEQSDIQMPGIWLKSGARVKF